ncbi:MlaC/ttg2D family ABC transporter substrate-binding protein [Litoreibacter roseus]|uniref:ABC transporter n=1 Tax=Litoreibacter roseus TaxID=2601869 RepID=A0A6N6JEW4_9RHOB|nr:ABC transporter substrate-binding protein [Litoreibacter roseus]GFE64766.1 ABC transporter [Litoreibacter roseus]
MVKNNVFTRRTFIAGAAALLATFNTRAASALTGSEAESLVVQAVNDINRIIASGKSENAMLRDFERVFASYADVPTVALSALGPAGRSASNGEKRAYIGAFQDYFTRKYGRRFREFVGGEITVNGSRKTKSFYEVNSIARLRGSSPFRVVWLVSDRSGKPQIFNIIIEGVNTLTSERVEIGAMLDRRGGDIGRLTADLKNAG